MLVAETLCVRPVLRLFLSLDRFMKTGRHYVCGEGGHWRANLQSCSWLGVRSVKGNCTSFVGMKRCGKRCLPKAEQPGKLRYILPAFCLKSLFFCLPFSLSNLLASLSYCCDTFPLPLVEFQDCDQSWLCNPDWFAFCRCYRAEQERRVFGTMPRSGASKLEPNLYAPTDPKLFPTAWGGLFCGGACIRGSTSLIRSGFGKR